MKTFHTMKYDLRGHCMKLHKITFNFQNQLIPRYFFVVFCTKLKPDLLTFYLITLAIIPLNNKTKMIKIEGFLMIKVFIQLINFCYFIFI